MMSSREHRVLVRNEHVAWTRSGPDIFLTLPADDRPFTVLSLSETAAAIWELFDGRRTVRDAAIEISRSWGIDDEEAEAAVDAFAESLLAEQLLRESSI